MTKYFMSHVVSLWFLFIFRFLRSVAKFVELVTLLKLSSVRCVLSIFTMCFLICRLERSYC